MAYILRLTDGSTTINFDGSAGYSLIGESWAPQRAQRNESEMGHVYEDVIETIPIVITGTSLANVLDKYATLSDLLDQAESWGMDDAGVDAVLFKYQPDGSVLANPLESPIWREPGSPRMLSAPSTVNEAGYRGNVMTPVIVTFTRLGQLLGDTEAEGSSTSTGNPAILTTTTFTDTPKIPVPYDAQIDFYDTGALSAVDSIQNMAMFFTNSANKLHIEEGEDASTDVGMTDTVVAGSSGGSVIRGTFGGQNTATYAQADWSSFDSGIRTIDIVAMIRSQDGVDFSTYARLGTDITSGEIVYSETVLVDGSDTNPQIVYYGPILIRQAMSKYDIRLVFDVISGTGDFDLDYFCIVGLDENIRSFYFENNAYRSREQLFIEHNLNSKRTPAIYQEDDPGPDTVYSGYRGDALLMASGNAISCLVLGGGGNSTNYVLEDSGGDELDIDLSVTRTMGYLTPL